MRLKSEGLGHSRRASVLSFRYRVQFIYFPLFFYISLPHSLHTIIITDDGMRRTFLNRLLPFGYLWLESALLHFCFLFLLPTWFLVLEHFMTKNLWFCLVDCRVGRLRYLRLERALLQFFYFFHTARLWKPRFYFLSLFHEHVHSPHCFLLLVQLEWPVIRFTHNFACQLCLLKLLINFDWIFIYFWFKCALSCLNVFCILG